MEEKKKIKIIFKSDFKCPCCNKIISMKKTRTLITEPVPAKYEEKLIIEKSRQQELKKFK